MSDDNPDALHDEQPEAFNVSSLPTTDREVTERPIDLVGQINTYLGRACLKHAMRDRVSYAVGMYAVQTGPEQVMPVMTVTLAIPSLVIDQNLQGTLMIQDLFLTETEVDRLVSEGLNNLRLTRIAQANQYGQHPNGQPPL